MSRTKTSRQTVARLGGLATAAKHDPQIYTAAARAVSNSIDRFLRDVPADLPEPERVRRAEAARRAHYARIGSLGGRGKAKGGRS